MKIVIISDLHIHPWQEYSVPLPNGAPSRLYASASVLNEVMNYCLEHKIYDVVIGGDLFHKRGVVFTQAYNLVVIFLASMKRAGIRVWMVDGNHDHANKAGSVHSVQGLAKAGLVREVDEQGWSNWSLGGELIVSGFSYCDSRELFEQRIEDADRNYRKTYRGVSRIAALHHGFKGAKVGTVLEYQVKESIDPKMLDGAGFQYLFSGHYHGRQRIGDLKNATYIGSPMEHVRGETAVQKGFLVYNSDKNTWKLVPVKRPQFVTLTQKMIDEKDYNIVSGNFVDVSYEELPKDPDIFKDRLYKKYEAVGVKLVPIPKRKTTATKRLDVDLSTDHRTLLERYLDFKEVTGKERKRLLAKGLALLEQSQE